jgi:valyl-tRNA synthetase
MTSSLTPQILTNWAGSPDRARFERWPMEVRVQAHDIIRTWLFYTIVQAHLHQDTLPWRRVVVSGWGLNEQGKRISKRDLDPNNRARFGAYDPYSVLTTHGADALRHWAARSSLGQDVRYSERDVKAGRKVVIKLWNIARFCEPHLAHGDGSADATTEDRWILHRMTEATRTATTALDVFDYAAARQAADDLLWDFADDWLELAKHRIWFPQRHGSETIRGAHLTMTLVLRRLLALYAPFLPFVTDELYATLYGAAEGAASIHLTPWPETPDDVQRVDEVEPVLAVLRTARSLRTERRISQSQEVETLIVDCTETLEPMVRSLEMSLLAASRARGLAYGQASRATGYEGLSVDLADAMDP